MATSLRETMSLAHTAQCKLHLAATRPDRNLRFVLGHALTLDNLTLRLVEIEEETAAVHKPKHASGIKFKAAGTGSTTRKRSPPPSRLCAIDPDEVEEDDEDDEPEDDPEHFSSDSDQDELALTRFPSGATKPTRQPAPQIGTEPPPLDPSDDSSSSDEDEPPVQAAAPSLPPRKQPDEATLRAMTKGDSDELLVNLYNSIKKCPCHGHKENAPEVTNLWAIPEEDEDGEKRADGIRIAVAEIKA
ncbi:hypothetical protein NA57DRAFT_59231 [Rhizodiscina lignyota]|uniref:Uncharacterized protein n=1 Tax=Rhizodiscina lignyota TaxID=1504668 RepID=A0A9P4M7V1_9PEZI|nr:hypothetical protein NA57DRAFT_59231 [Rhizodiscina lignyota]